MPPISPSSSEESRRGPSDETGPRFLLIGRVVKPHGIRGEVRVRPYTDLPERFSWLESVYLGLPDADAPDGAPVAVESSRPHQDVVLLKLANCPDRNAAELLRGAGLFVAESEAIPLAEDEYFLFELEGMAVYSDAEGLLGHIVDVIETRANNVFVVQGDQGELLLPDIADVVEQIDFENGRMQVKLLPGLLP